MMFQVENVILELNKTFPSDGLLPIYINPHKGSRSYSTITFGAMGDRYVIILFWMLYLPSYAVASMSSTFYRSFLSNRSIYDDKVDFYEVF